MQTQIEAYGDESPENQQSAGERALAVVEVIEARQERTYTPGQGSALDRVGAIRRKADAFPVEEWPIQLIEAHLYDMGHVFASLEVRGEVAGPNCRRLARQAEALHQDLIGELQAREHWTRDDRQYLTNMFGNCCSQIQEGRSPGYTGESCYFDVLRDLADISERIEGVGR